MGAKPLQPHYLSPTEESAPAPGSPSPVKLFGSGLDRVDLLPALLRCKPQVTEEIPGFKSWLCSLQAGIRIARRNINNLRYADDTTLVAESEEELNATLRSLSA